MARLVILPAARIDLIEIGDFIALDNPERAASFVTEIESRMIDVAERPCSFPARDELHEGLRSARHGRYLIFFVEAGDEVRIVRVLHGALICAVAASAVGTVAFFGLHQPAGWVAIGIVGVRVGLGILGAGPARFARFVRGPWPPVRSAAIELGLHAHRCPFRRRGPGA